LSLRNAAQVALDAVVVPLSGTIKMPAHYPSTGRS
jgi:hypothetical protein